MYLKKAISSLIMIYLSVIIPLEGQTTFQPKPVAYNLKGVLYDYEKSFEARVHAQGFSIAYKRGTLKTYYRTTYQNFEFGYIKDRREQRTNKNIAIPGENLSHSYSYGKAHEFYQLRYSRGVKTYLSEKTRRRGLAVGWIYEGGLTLGLLKPYTLEVIRIDDADPTMRRIEEISYEESLDNEFLNEQQIYGGTNFFKGWGSIQPTVGLHGKIAAHWALGAFDQKVRAFETGLMLDIFPQKIPILIERDDIYNNFFFAKLYLAFQFGDRRRKVGDSN